MLTINNVEKIDTDMQIAGSHFRIKYDDLVSNDDTYFFDIYNGNDTIIAYIMLGRLDFLEDSTTKYKLELKKAHSREPLISNFIPASEMGTFDTFIWAINNYLLWNNKSL